MVEPGERRDPGAAGPGRTDGATNGGRRVCRGAGRVAGAVRRLGAAALLVLGAALPSQPANAGDAVLPGRDGRQPGPAAVIAASVPGSLTRPGAARERAPWRPSELGYGFLRNRLAVILWDEYRPKPPPKPQPPPPEK